MVALRFKSVDGTIHFSSLSHATAFHKNQCKVGAFKKQFWSKEVVSCILRYILAIFSTQRSAFEKKKCNILFIVVHSFCFCSNGGGPMGVGVNDPF